MADEPAAPPPPPAAPPPPPSEAAKTATELDRNKSFLRRVAEQIGKNILHEEGASSPWGTQGAVQDVLSIGSNQLFQYFERAPSSTFDRKGLEPLHAFTGVKSLTLGFARIDTGNTEIDQALTQVRSDLTSAIKQSHDLLGQQLGFLYKEVKTTDANITRVNTKISKLPSQDDYQLLVQRIKSLESKKSEEIKPFKFSEIPERETEGVLKAQAPSKGFIEDAIDTYLKFKAADWVMKGLAGLASGAAGLGFRTIPIIGQIWALQMQQNEEFEAWKKAHGLGKDPTRWGVEEEKWYSKFIPDLFRGEQYVKWLEEKLNKDYVRKDQATTFLGTKPGLDYVKEWWAATGEKDVQTFLTQKKQEALAEYDLVKKGASDALAQVQSVAKTTVQELEELKKRAKEELESYFTPEGLKEKREKAKNRWPDWLFPEYWKTTTTPQGKPLSSFEEFQKEMGITPVAPPWKPEPLKPELRKYSTVAPPISPPWSPIPKPEEKRDYDINPPVTSPPWSPVPENFYKKVDTTPPVTSPPWSPVPENFYKKVDTTPPVTSPPWSPTAKTPEKRDYQLFPPTSDARRPMSVLEQEIRDKQEAEQIILAEQQKLQAQKPGMAAHGLAPHAKGGLGYTQQLLEQQILNKQEAAPIPEEKPSIWQRLKKWWQSDEEAATPAFRGGTGGDLINKISYTRGDMGEQLNEKPEVINLAAQQAILLQATTEIRIKSPKIIFDSPEIVLEGTVKTGTGAVGGGEFRGRGATGSWEAPTTTPLESMMGVPPFEPLRRAGGPIGDIVQSWARDAILSGHQELVRGGAASMGRGFPGAGPGGATAYKGAQGYVSATGRGGRGGYAGGGEGAVDVPIGPPVGTERLGEQDAHGYRRGHVSVKPWLVEAVRAASMSLPEGYRAEVISTVDSRKSGTVWHPRGDAIDIQIYDEKGKKVPYIGSPNVPGYGVYERYALAVRQYQEKYYPEQKFTWGGQFNTGVPYDRMHMQSGGVSARQFTAEQLATPVIPAERMQEYRTAYAERQKTGESQLAALPSQTVSAPGLTQTSTVTAGPMAGTPRGMAEPAAFRVPEKSEWGRSGAPTNVMMGYAMDQLRSEGVPEKNLRAAAAHLVGQAQMESGLRPGVSHDVGTGYGIYGARLERRTRMLEWLRNNGYAQNSAEGQMRYMAHEAMTDNSYRQTANILRNASAETFARDTPIVTKNFEAPRVVNYRTGSVESAYREGGVVPTPPTVAPPGPAPHSATSKSFDWVDRTSTLPSTEKQPQPVTPVEPITEVKLTRPISHPVEHRDIMAQPWTPTPATPEKKVPLEAPVTAPPFTPPSKPKELPAQVSHPVEHRDITPPAWTPTPVKPELKAQGLEPQKREEWKEVPQTPRSERTGKYGEETPPKHTPQPQHEKNASKPAGHEGGGGFKGTGGGNPSAAHESTGRPSSPGDRGESPTGGGNPDRCWICDP